MSQLVADPIIAAALVAGLALIAAALGFFLGQWRPRAQDLARIAELERELEAARSSAETTRNGIDEHFEASAELFGKLAQNYRSLFEHWADSATKLGVSETRVDAIIEHARSRLLENGRTIESGPQEQDTRAEAGAAPESGEPGGQIGVEEASAEAGPVPSRAMKAEAVLSPETASNTDEGAGDEGAPRSASGS